MLIMTTVLIQPEQNADVPAVQQLLTAAFAEVPHSDQSEPALVERLRNNLDFIPQLSLVARLQEQVVGYLLLTPVRINNLEENHPSLALAPVAVAPTYQGQGIGGQLIKAAHARARILGYQSVVLLGEPAYYQRFGYE